VLVLIIILKNQVLKKAETEVKNFGGLVLVGLILSGYLLIFDRKETI
jgi:hypothetical protein